MNTAEVLTPSSSKAQAKDMTAEEMAEKVEGYLKGSTTKNALEAAKNAPLPPRAEDDSSEEIQIT